MTVPALTPTVRLPARLRRLIALPGGGDLRATYTLSASGAAIALAAITAGADREQGVAFGIEAPSKAERLCGLVVGHADHR